MNLFFENNPPETITALSDGKEITIKLHCLDFKVKAESGKPVDLLIMYASPDTSNDFFNYENGKNFNLKNS